MQSIQDDLDQAVELRDKIQQEIGEDKSVLEHLKTKVYTNPIEGEAEAKLIGAEWKLKDLLIAGIVLDKNKVEESKEKQELIIPGKGKLISEFAVEISEEIKHEEKLFFRVDLKEIVEIGKIKDNDDKLIYNGFMRIKPNRFITLLENYVTPGVWHKNDQNSWEFKKKSITGDQASTLLQSEILQNALPIINRIFTVPLPIIYKGELTFPRKGYDKRFNSWLPYDSPEIEDPNMELDKAKEILLNLYKEFCFQTKQDYINAIAGLLTPFLRGMFSSFSTRTPVFFYIANRERAGKDYCAGITGIVYEGASIEESPISTSEKARGDNTDELRKKILAALINGKKRMHFSNNKGYINNAVFEAVTTAEQYTDRILGKSDTATFENELDFSLSGNVGIGFTPDLANRCRFVRLFLDIEDANARKFNTPNLHRNIKDKRGLILSALYSLVKNWFDCEKPKGSKNFSSFPQWAEICGGIMECAGYDNPANPDKETLTLGGDSETQDMKELFEMCYSIHPEQFIQKKEIKNMVINSDREIFTYIDFLNKSDQTKFGNKINKFVGRVLSGIRLVVKDRNIRSARQEFKFTKDKIEQNKDEIFGKGGNLGNIRQPLTPVVPRKSEVNIYNVRSKATRVTEVAK